jgi:hypothetical protein
MPHNDIITSYFTEEKLQSAIFIIIGVIAILFALIFLWLIKYSFFKGMAIPLFFIGMMQVSAGIITYNQSQKYSAKMELLLSNKPEEVKSEELKRMQIVLKNYANYKLTELILLLIGIALFILFNKSPQTFWKGLGLGLLLQASVLLALHLLSEQSGKMYVEQLIN